MPSAGESDVFLIGSQVNEDVPDTFRGRGFVTRLTDEGTGVIIAFDKVCGHSFTSLILFILGGARVVHPHTGHLRCDCDTKQYTK